MILHINTDKTKLLTFDENDNDNEKTNQAQLQALNTCLNKIRV